MIKLKTIKVVLITILIITSIYFFIDQPTTSSFAYTTECPNYMDDYECLDFLEEQADNITNDQEDLVDRISNEQYNQLTLNGQISYINGQITQSEKNISILEVDIETKNIEIKILGKDIIETQNRINLITQEVNSLESSAEKRVTVAYKYSFITPLELLLEEKNFDTILRKMKYLATTRQKDRESLEDMSDKRDILEDEEVVLSQQKEEAQTKRNEIEIHKTDLFEEQEILSEQRSEQATLLAISQQKEAEYEVKYAELKKQADEVDKGITEAILKLYQTGQIPINKTVTAGETIGFQGHTGCSLGSHLHFGISSGNAYYPNINPFANGYFTGGLYYGSLINDGLRTTPLPSTKITQTFHSGYALDMQSTTSGNQSGDLYYKGIGQISCPSYINIDAYLPGYFSLKGEGAPVQAIAAGVSTVSQTDQYGGKYVIVDHQNGEVSLYLHLR